MAIKYPETMPLLTAKDICRYELDNGYGQHCLQGWLNEAFGRPQQYVAIPRLGKLTVFLGCDPENYNDDKTIPKATIARKWNEFVASLGYTEIVKL